VPRGDVLGSYDTYPEAQSVVNRLAKAEFPVKGLAIVGHDLKTVERIGGRLSYGRAALSGALSGIWFGLFFGLLLFLFSPEPEFSFILAAVFIGAGFGMLLGLVSYAFARRRRDFASQQQVLASSYQVIIDPMQTARARTVLAGGNPDAPISLTESPRGEQVSPTPSSTSSASSPADAPPSDSGPVDAPAEKRD
jgi:hypothetical protein